jgi:hypothetical protein
MIPIVHSSHNFLMDCLPCSFLPCITFKLRVRSCCWIRFGLNITGRNASR